MYQMYPAIGMCLLGAVFLLFIYLFIDMEVKIWYQKKALKKQ